MKKLVSLLVVLTMAFMCCAAFAEGVPADQIKVGYVFVGDENEGYTAAHYEGAKAMMETLGLSEDQVVIRWTIPETEECYDAAVDLADAGCNIVFANSFGHESYMIQAAAEMYCQPKVDYSTEEWEINGKTVLEVIIPKDKHHKHKAPDSQGTYKIFVRVKDENLVADSVLIKVWKYEKFSRPAKITFTETETQLLHFLSEHGQITLHEFQELAHISRRKAEAILADFIIVGTIELVQTSQNTNFRLNEPPKNE